MASVNRNRNFDKKKRTASGSSVNNSADSKSGRFTRTPEPITISNILKETNSVLFDENDGNEVVDFSLRIQTLKVTYI